MPIFSFRRIIVTVVAVLTATSQATAEDGAVETVSALMTDNFSVEIDRGVEFVWEQVKRLYIDGDRYRQEGGEVAPLEGDPEAYLGGYKTIRRDDDGSIIRESAFRFSRIDEANKFIAMSIDTASNGKVLVSHEVRPNGDKSVYSLIIHAFMDVEFEPGDNVTAEAVRDQMAMKLSEHHAGVAEIWENQKEMIQTMK